MNGLVSFGRGRIGACNKFFGGLFGMPTYVTVVNEDNTLRVVPKGVGLRKWATIKYFSGTLFCLNTTFHNLSNNTKTAECGYDLFALHGVGDNKGVFIGGGQDSFDLKAREKLRRFWGFGYLPQGGYYSVRLRLKEGTKQGEADLVYFDALPRDATSWSLQIAVFTGIVMLIIGGLLGKFVFG